MEYVLVELESTCEEKMQQAIQTEEGLGIEYDEDVVCDVCRSPEGEDGNEMVFCDKCNVCVHQVRKGHGCAAFRACGKSECQRLKVQIGGPTICPHQRGGSEMMPLPAYLTLQHLDLIRGRKANICLPPNHSAVGG